MASTAEAPAWGLSISQGAELGSGTVYPILERLVDHGWITGREETGPHPGRPARRYYELTSAGRAQAAEAFNKRRSLFGK